MFSKCNFYILKIKRNIFALIFLIFGASLLLFSTSNVIGYFFVPYNCLLEVKEKKYIYNLTTQIGQIVLSVTEIVMLLLKIRFEYILIMHSLVKLSASLIEVYICKKQFPEIKITQKEKDYNSSWFVVCHKVIFVKGCFFFFRLFMNIGVNSFFDKLIKQFTE